MTYQCRCRTPQALVVVLWQFGGFLLCLPPATHHEVYIVRASENVSFRARLALINLSFQTRLFLLLSRGRSSDRFVVLGSTRGGLFDLGSFSLEKC